MSKKKISKEKSIRRTRNGVELLICLSVIAGGVYYIKTVSDNSFLTPQMEHKSVAEEVEILTEATEETTPPPEMPMYEIHPVDTHDAFSGDLILVNNDHQYYSSGKEDLVSIMEMNDETERSEFLAVDYSYSILREVYEPMAQMIDDFYDIYHNDTLIIYGSYRSHDFQQELYENDLAQNGSDSSTLVAKPGYSEHETGYAFDFSETVNYEYDGTGDFAWFTENCYKYGFILRYPEDKEDITEIRYEPWHFRYVGIPHAYYMTKNGICLEEYIEQLRSYTYDGEHLAFTDHNGQAYEVYFVPADASADQTPIPVPPGAKYDISGNNIDGFIVTITAGESADPEPAAETSTEASTDAADEETSETPAE